MRGLHIRYARQDRPPNKHKDNKMITSKELSQLIKDYQTIVKIQQNEIKRLKEQVKQLKQHNQTTQG